MRSTSPLGTSIPQRALHDVARRHHPARYGLELSVDHVGDEQLVGGEVVLLVAVKPHMGVAVLLVGLVFCARPLAYSLVRRVAVPLTVPISERQILKCCH